MTEKASTVPTVPDMAAKARERIEAYTLYARETHLGGWRFDGMPLVGTERQLIAKCLSRPWPLPPLDFYTPFRREARATLIREKRLRPSAELVDLDPDGRCPETAWAAEVIAAAKAGAELKPNRHELETLEHRFRELRGDARTREGIEWRDSIRAGRPYGPAEAPQAAPHATPQGSLKDTPHAERN